MEKRIYQIPRKVNERIKIIGLGVKEMILMLIPIAFAVFLYKVAPMGLFVVLATLSVGGSYLLLTQEMSVGIRADHYIWTRIKFFMMQKEYHLLSGPAEVGQNKHIIRRKRAEEGGFKN